MINPYRPLFLIKDFNSLTDPYGIQSRNFINALIKKGIIPTILTSDRNELLEFQNANIIPVHEMNVKILAGFIRRTIPELIEIPDVENLTFKPNLLKQVSRKFDKKFDFDWIHSLSNPTSNHLAAIHLKEKYGKPWIAHFYDPFIGNNFRYKRQRFLTIKKYNTTIESEIASKADLIIHTNQNIANEWKLRYGEMVANKILILPFNHNLVEYTPVNNTSNNSPRIVLYAGKLYQKRNLDDILKTLDYLESKIENLDCKIKFRLIGNVSNEILNDIKKHKKQKYFEVIGNIEPSRLLDFYQKADALLVIDAPFNNSLFFPSKLIEYFIQQKPIIGITPKDSITSQLLRDARHFPIENAKFIEIGKFIEMLIDNPEKLNGYEHDFYKLFSPNRISDIYINEVLKTLKNFKYEKRS